MENLPTQLAELFAAIQSGNSQQVRRLLASDVSPNQCNAEGKTALMVAVELGNPDIIQLLCTATVNHPRPAQLFFDAEVTASHVSAFHLATPLVLQPADPTFAELGGIAITPSAVGPIAPTFSRQVATVKQPETTPNTLEAAVCQNDLSAVQALLKAGASLYPKNWYDTPILVTAAAKGNADIVRSLIAAGANVNSGYDRLPLHIAAEHGHLEVVQRLIHAGADVQAREENGQTALMGAATRGHLAIVRTLVDYGADVNAACHGETALMLAAQNGHPAVCEFLSPYVLSTYVLSKARYC